MTAYKHIDLNKKRSMEHSMPALTPKGHSDTCRIMLVWDHCGVEDVELVMSAVRQSTWLGGWIFCGERDKSSIPWKSLKPSHPHLEIFQAVNGSDSHDNAKCNNKVCFIDTRHLHLLNTCRNKGAKSNIIMGAQVDFIRHQAMTAGEAGAEFLFFKTIENGQPLFTAMDETTFLEHALWLEEVIRLPVIIQLLSLESEVIRKVAKQPFSTVAVDGMMLLRSARKSGSNLEKAFDDLGRSFNSNPEHVPSSSAPQATAFIKLNLISDVFVSYGVNSLFHTFVMRVHSLASRIVFASLWALLATGLVTRPAASQTAIPSPPTPGLIDQKIELPSQGVLLHEQAYSAFQKGEFISAYQLAENAAALGNVGALVLKAELLLAGKGVVMDVSGALAALEQAVSMGSVDALYALGLLYHEGQIVQQNNNRAVELFSQAAEMSHAGAAYALGLMYVNGEEVLRNMQMASHFFQIAADQELPSAQLALGLMYMDGEGIAFSLSRGVELIQKSARAGFAEAQLQLAKMLFAGDGVEQNNELAVEWLKLAANQGLGVAQNQLARAFASGTGVEIDTLQAAKWHLLAKENGVSDLWLDSILASLSKADYDNLVRKLSPLYAR